MKKNLPSVSLIISVYDNIVFLKAVLDSLRFQSITDFEIIISEDAEHKTVRDFVNSYAFSQPYKHLSQPDLGWQKNKALNRAILASSGDYLIFIDGDSVLHPRFVEMHLFLAGHKHIVAGKRIKLNAAESKFLMDEPAHLLEMNKRILRMILSGEKMGCAFVEEGIYISPTSPLGFLPKIRTMSQLKGCNMSMYKEALLAINGFDEDFIRPAIGEDIDLGWRFEGMGYALRSARNLAVQYHLDHPQGWNDQSENIALMEEHQAHSYFVCRNGIRKN